MTLRQLYEQGCARLRAAGIDEADTDARYLLLEAFRMDGARFLAVRDLPLTDADAASGERYLRMTERRADRIPLQHILGYREFMGLRFFVDPSVLIPRQDTETLAELVLAEQKTAKDGGECRLLDLCTGSGCIAVSLAVLGEFSHAAAADVSEEALRTARENAVRLLPPSWKVAGAEGGREEDTPRRKIFRLYRGDLFAAVPRGEKYDILTANPPYIPTGDIPGLQPEVRDHEPAAALDGGRDGLAFYRRIAAEAAEYLNPGARIYLEIGWDQAAAVKALLEAAGYRQIEVFRDLPGKDRVVRAAWEPGGIPA